MDVFTYRLSNGIALTWRSTSRLGKQPTIILCHGFAGVQNFLLPSFAEAFVVAGYATVTFDYRGFGDSGGERGRLVPTLQIDDIVSVVNWVKNNAAVDTERIALWGTSLGGGHVFGAAAKNIGIKCVISQLGFSDGNKLITGAMSGEERESFIALLDKVAEKNNSSGKEMFVSITRVLSDVESKSFFEMNKALHPNMDIKIPFLTVREIMNYKPEQYAKSVVCPALVVVAGKDRVNPIEQGRALYESIAANEKNIYEVAEAAHYDFYKGEFFRDVISVQIDWLKRYL
ncbi:hypothetical protein CK911_01225 [Aeromonas sp. CU5]|uniref:UilS family quorum-quenching N-acyl-homoserine lactonase n=1 Tax=Aeromonas sp. CU5 TaxID=2033033 RepID=UPI000BFDB607|nr:alpha/beta fold hydrolase [Aeromonas sp. CU5]ATL91568.1 hypothetical protein CK911_01225 [Aeromonas sp. CU5]